jgi:hypothetical protein
MKHSAPSTWRVEDEVTGLALPFVPCRMRFKQEAVEKLVDRASGERPEAARSSIFKRHRDKTSLT